MGQKFWDSDPEQGSMLIVAALKPYAMTSRTNVTLPVMEAFALISYWMVALSGVKTTSNKLAVMEELA